MPMARRTRIDLRRLILALAVISALVTLANAVHAGYRVQREQLIRSTLESNRVYATKVAAGTDHFLQAAMQQLGYSAGLLGTLPADADGVAAEARRLKSQTRSFNTVLIVDQHGTVRAFWPERDDLLGDQLQSAGSREALDARRPLVSRPYLSASGTLVVTLSHPILADDGRYLGYIAGGIHLHEPNILQTLLGEHFYRDGSYLYVVDRDGHLVYHHDRTRIGQQVHGNPVIDAVRRGESGAQRLVNSLGVDMLAGYAPIPLNGWGVVAQRPTEVTLLPMGELMRDVLWRTIPAGILLMAVIWWCARRISQPLWRLARHAREHEGADAIAQVQAVKAWYFEVENLKQAVLSSFGTLHDRIGRLDRANATDPLTGLQNRRGLDAILARWQEDARGFAVIMLDIDHFKRINDGHGHDAGDEVIRTMALLMRDASRSSDVLCRSGGEEFLILLPDTGLEDATAIAERLRQRTEAQAFGEVGQVTLSAGVAVSAGSDGDAPLALKRADAAMYQAKRQGRNRVVAAS